MTSSGAPLALTMGEPAGIGGEIALMAWARRREGVPAFFVLDDPARLDAIGRELDRRMMVRPIAEPEEAVAAFADALPVLPVTLAAPSRPGAPDAANAASVIASIDRAVALAREGRAAAVVTNPIQKSTLYDAGFEYPGHTEYLGARAGSTEPPVMMLACTELKVVSVTIHLALRAAVAALSSEAIVHCGRITAAALEQDFGIGRPRIAVAALNPHAGEAGHMGDEEARIIAPAIDRLRGFGVDCDGPYAADTLFHDAARGRYDAVLCMYHDQALIPLKTLDFERGVNVTLGLPFVRTSPDHGTALDIAGTRTASPESLIAALRMAADMAAQRARGRADHAVA